MKYLVALICAGVVTFATSSVMAQGPGGPGGGRGFGGPGGDLFGLLNNESVQKELEVVPSQLDEIQKIGQDMREQMMEMFRGLRGASEEDRQAAFDKIRTLRTDMEKDLSKVLMPAQMQRLKQIQVQQQSRGRGGLAITNDNIAEQLGLTESQIADLRAKSEELQTEMRAKLDELRKSADDELLKLLTPEQQKKWKELIGEPFDMQVQRGGFRGGPGGQRGPQRGGSSSSNNAGEI